MTLAGNTSNRNSRVATLVAALALVAAACSSSGDPAPATTAPTTATTTVPPVPTTTVAPTTTLPPEPTEYPPGVVWEQSTVAEDSRAVASLQNLPAGWIATSATPDIVDRRPAVHISADGVEWTIVDLPTERAASEIQNVAYGPAGYVAIGFARNGCNAAYEACTNGDGVVWVSDDAQTWEVVEPPELAGPNKVVPYVIRVIDDRYVIVGRDEQDGIDQVWKVWSSTDGREWELTAVLDDPDWPMMFVRSFIEWDGGYVISGIRAVCELPWKNPNHGWVYALTGLEAKAWSSADGVEWTEMDLAGNGLIEPQDTVGCKVQDFADEENEANANGVFESFGGRLYWRSDSGAISEYDPAGDSWAPSSRTLPAAVLDARNEVGTVEDDYGFLSVGLTGINRDELTVTVARSDDLTTWEDLTGEATTFGPVPDDAAMFGPTLIASDGENAVVLYQFRSIETPQMTPITALVSTVAPIPGS